MKHTRKDRPSSHSLHSHWPNSPSASVPTQPSQAPNIEAWLPTATYSRTETRHPVISLPWPQSSDCHWTYCLSAKNLLFKRVLHDLAHGCFLITFPAFPLQVPAVFAPANSSAENTLSPDSHSSLPHFRGLPWTSNWKALPLSLHLYADSFSPQRVLLPDINLHIQVCLISLRPSN